MLRSYHFSTFCFAAEDLLSFKLIVSYKYDLSADVKSPSPYLFMKKSKILLPVYVGSAFWTVGVGCIYLQHKL